MSYKPSDKTILGPVFDEARKFIAEFEGCSLTPYQCSAGVWTQGYGHTKGINKNSPEISQEKAEAWLLEDILMCHDDLCRLVTVPITEGMHIALLSFIFNFGYAKCSGYSLFTELNKGNYAVAAEKFGDYVLANGAKLPGLVNRRAKEKEMFKRGGFPDEAPCA
ncbi:MAG: lysozyme [Cloacibacillus porcorum]|nr:lysozyme [Cloacibacillus porcorum]